MTRQGVVAIVGLTTVLIAAGPISGILLWLRPSTAHAGVYIVGRDGATVPAASAGSTSGVVRVIFARPPLALLVLISALPVRVSGVFVRVSGELVSVVARSMTVPRRRRALDGHALLSAMAAVVSVRWGRVTPVLVVACAAWLGAAADREVVLQHIRARSAMAVGLVSPGGLCLRSAVRSRISTGVCTGIGSVGV